VLFGFISHDLFKLVVNVLTHRWIHSLLCTTLPQT